MMLLELGNVRNGLCCETGRREGEEESKSQMIWEELGF
jgi:hypothetical protein